jgi:hypothetical protein
MAKELDLPGPFEVDPATGKRIASSPDSGQAIERSAGHGAPEITA